jgi:hypothetical protein
MNRGVILIVVAASAAAVGAAPPSALTRIAGGLWEVSGTPGTKEPIRECVADVTALAQFEHRASHCTRSVVSEHGDSTLISYKCGGAGFGQSTIEVITPRSLKISTQGISDQLPFNYVLQAHRVGECAKTPPVTPH